VLLQSFKTSLAGGARLMLTYLYSDDVQKFGNLDSIARRTGLKLVGPQQGRASLAEIMIRVPASTET